MLNFALARIWSLVDGGKPPSDSGGKSAADCSVDILRQPSADWRRLGEVGCRMTTIRSSSSDNPEAYISAAAGA